MAVGLLLYNESVTMQVANWLHYDVYDRNHPTDSSRVCDIWTIVKHIRTSRYVAELEGLPTKGRKKGTSYYNYHACVHTRCSTRVNMHGVSRQWFLRCWLYF